MSINLNPATTFGDNGLMLINARTGVDSEIDDSILVDSKYNNSFSYNDQYIGLQLRREYPYGSAGSEKMINTNNRIDNLLDDVSSKITLSILTKKSLSTDFELSYRYTFPFLPSMNFYEGIKSVVNDNELLVYCRLDEEDYKIKFDIESYQILISKNLSEYLNVFHYCSFDNGDEKIDDNTETTFQINFSYNTEEISLNNAYYDVFIFIRTVLTQIVSYKYASEQIFISASSARLELLSLLDNDYKPIADNSIVIEELLQNSAPSGDNYFAYYRRYYYFEGSKLLNNYYLLACSYIRSKYALMSNQNISRIEYNDVNFIYLINSVILYNIKTINQKVLIVNVRFKSENIGICLLGGEIDDKKAIPQQIVVMPMDVMVNQFGNILKFDRKYDVNQTVFNFITDISGYGIIEKYLEIRGAQTDDGGFNMFDLLSINNSTRIIGDLNDTDTTISPIIDLRVALKFRKYYQNIYLDPKDKSFVLTYTLLSDNSLINHVNASITKERVHYAYQLDRDVLSPNINISQIIKQYLKIFKDKIFRGFDNERHFAKFEVLLLGVIDIFETSGSFNFNIKSLLADGEKDFNMTENFKSTLYDQSESYEDKRYINSKLNIFQLIALFIAKIERSDVVSELLRLSKQPKAVCYYLAYNLGLTNIKDLVTFHYTSLLLSNICQQSEILQSIYIYIILNSFKRMDVARRKLTLILLKNFADKTNNSYPIITTAIKALSCLLQGNEDAFDLILNEVRTTIFKFFERNYKKLAVLAGNAAFSYTMRKFFKKAKTANDNSDSSKSDFDQSETSDDISDVDAAADSMADASDVADLSDLAFM